MSSLYTPLIVLHVLSAVLWFAYPLGLSRGLRLALNTNWEAFAIQAQEASRRAKMGLMSGAFTLGTGLALVTLLGGMKAVPTTFHAAIGLVVLMLVLSFHVTRQCASLDQRLASNEEETCRASIRKIGITAGFCHLFWLATVVLMYLK